MKSRAGVKHPLGQWVWLRIVAFSAISLILIPCFWQRRIQAGDLSSHIYNAWIASLIDSGKAHGLWISPQLENVLFDVMLERLLVRVGPGLAQRIAVSTSVLLFASGAILLIFRTGSRNWWFAWPCVAVLSYGLIFHFGFFNFYISLGLCLWYLAIFWRSDWQVRVAAMSLLLVAWTAHPIPVVWSLGTSLYVAVTSRLPAKRRYMALILGCLCLAITRFTLSRLFWDSWDPSQLLHATGTTQLLVFGSKYLIPSTLLLLMWLILLRRLVKAIGIVQLSATIPFQLWLLNVVAIALLPDQVMFPQFGLPLGFIAQRLSLAAAIMLCAVLAAAPLGNVDKIGLALVAVSFFALLYADDKRLNEVEDRIDSAVSHLSPAQRFIMKVSGSSLREMSVRHSLDRACIGHCYSYANYEPSSRQFRIRARPGNGIVLDDYGDVAAVERGSYFVQRRDLPLYALYLCGSNSREICTRQLNTGAVSNQLSESTAEGNPSSR